MEGSGVVVPLIVFLLETNLSPPDYLLAGHLIYLYVYAVRIRLLVAFWMY